MSVFISASKGGCECCPSGILLLSHEMGAGDADAAMRGAGEATASDLSQSE